MCHVSPTATLFSAVIATCSTGLLLYHMWRFNRFRCLLFKKDDAFRRIVTWALTFSVFALMTSQIIQTYVKYHEYYVYIPKVGIRIKPFQLWNKHYVDLFRTSNWFLVLGVVLLQVVHLEEILFWGYLIQTIKAQRAQPWFRSIYFKLWCIGVVTCTGVCFGVAGIETEVLTRMEVNIFMAGSVLSLVFTCGSLLVSYMFPTFIEESSRQGANPDVIAKLQFFKSMHNVRTVFRGIYSVALVVLAADGLSAKQKINHQEFWVDVFFATSVFCIFASVMLSLLILLPRSMQEEGGYRKTTGDVFVRHTSVPASQIALSDPSAMAAHGRHESGASSLPPYHSPTSSSHALRRFEVQGPWAILGDRLNLEKEEVRALIANNAAMHEDEEERDGRAYEMPFARADGRDY